MAKTWNGVREGAKVAIRLTGTAKEIGRDRNGWYLQTEDNRFYNDSETILSVFELAPPPKPLKYPTTDGSILRYEGRSGDDNLRLVRGGQIYTLDGGLMFTLEQAEAEAYGIKYTIIYDAGATK